MSHNISLALNFFYTESAITALNASELYAHVKKTTMHLGIPTPARAHVKKVGDGTIFIEHLSCHPTGLKKLEKAISMTEGLINTFGLIAITCSSFSDNNPPHSKPQVYSVGPTQFSSHKQSSPSLTPPTYRPSHPSSQASTRSSSGTAERTFIPPPWESRLPQNVPHRPYERGASDPSLQPPPPAPQNKPPEPSRIQRQYPSSTLPPKPSWVADSNGPSHSTRVIPKTEPISPAIAAFPLGEARSPRASDSSLRERTTSRIEGSPESQRIFSKREHGLEEMREDGEIVVHKRRRLENDLLLYEESSRPHESTDRTNDKRPSTSSAERDDRPKEDREANIQNLRKNVSDLERSLHKEKTKVGLLREELEEERRKRLRAELIVEDIRREMKDPFIVPSLLDAFITITDISNVCMEDLH